MNVSIPGLGDIIAVVKAMPKQFDQLIERMDTLIDLVKETNKLLKEKP